MREVNKYGKGKQNGSLTLDDVMKKYGATPYIPGQEIHMTLTENQIITLDRILRGVKERLHEKK